MLHKLYEKPAGITWYDLNPGLHEVNWSCVTDFGRIRTWHMALAVISLGKAARAAGETKVTLLTQ